MRYFSALILGSILSVFALLATAVLPLWQMATSGNMSQVVRQSSNETLSATYHGVIGRFAELLGSHGLLYFGCGIGFALGLTVLEALAKKNKFAWCIIVSLQCSVYLSALVAVAWNVYRAHNSLGHEASMETVVISGLTSAMFWLWHVWSSGTVPGLGLLFFLILLAVRYRPKASVASLDVSSSAAGADSQESSQPAAAKDESSGG